MDLDTYHCTVNPRSGLYEFYSEGPNGKIKKVVNYQLLEKSNSGMQTFNLCFGDWDEKNQSPDDTCISNNGDSTKVLATVASTVITFTGNEGSCIVQAEGTTPARTRLYQMGINAHWRMIDELFFVKGYFDGEWEWFRPGRNYEAFSVCRK